MSFRPNPNLAAELETQGRLALVEKAKRAATEADKRVHSAMPRQHSGRVIVGEVNGDVAVINTNYGAHLEEWGLAKTPLYAPLRRGVRASGLRLQEQ